MGFRFQRRINLGGGWGLNTSNSGGSISRQGRHGSIGTKGFSLRTGIPGVGYRGRWGKNDTGVAVIVAVISLVIFAAVQLLIVLVPIVWQCLYMACTHYL